MAQTLDDILPRVTKPARYTGGEVNAVRKDHAGVDVRFALAFPDVYEIGMSNLGLRILYEIVNRRGDALAERVFAPWPDMEAEMRASGLPLFTLESRRPVGEFDILGFSLGYELTYTNVLNMLDLAGIPVRSSERTKDHPLVIAGGCCTVNPEPMAEFIDAFVIGEGEEVIHELIDAFQAHRDLHRHELLGKLGEVEGVYVPSHEPSAVSDQPVGQGETPSCCSASAGRTSVRSSGCCGAALPLDVRQQDDSRAVRRRIVRDLDSAEFTERPIVPYLDTVHDRVSLEVMRGCSRGCRFCQAGMIYRPVRERSREKLLEAAARLEACTGYDEIGLLSLSTTDYTDCEELVRALVRDYEPRKVGVSLPSIRADASCVELAAEIRKVRKSGLTLAPEAGTQRLRDVINKNVTEHDLLSAVEAAFRCGWRTIKLYFMVGLPTETDEDVLGIARLATEVAQVARRMKVRPTINVSVSSFVPKPHTPFQWRAQDTIEELERKQSLLKDAIRDKSIQLSWHDARTSALEAVLARGDRLVGEAVYLAWKAGCRFDAWHEYFDYSKWLDAFVQAGLDPVWYANRRRDYDEPLPWDHIDCGISRQFLISEDERAEKGETTPDCRLDKCSGCGINRLISPCPSSREPSCPPAPSRPTPAGYIEERRSTAEPDSLPAPLQPAESPARDQAHARNRIALRLRKGEEVKYLSHLDLMRAFERALRRAGMPIAYSEGFNPRPRMSWGNAIGVGVTSDDERVVLEFAQPVGADQVRERLNSCMPTGIVIVSAESVPEGVRSPLSGLNASAWRITVSCPAGCDCASIRSAVDRVLASSEVHVLRARRDKDREVDLRPHIIEADVVQCSPNCAVLEVALRSGDSGGARPQDFLQALRSIEPGIEMKAIHRIAQYRA